MSVQFKFRDRVGQDRRLEIIKSLGEAGFTTKSLFPGQIFTVSKADTDDVKAVKAALTDFGKDIEYVEASPGRKLKA
jgi:hypothetical protein